MRHKIGETVSCASSGPYPGRRIGKIIEFSITCGKPHLPALIEYTDYPEFIKAWISDICSIHDR